MRQEWAQRLVGDPTGSQRALVLVRVGPCAPQGLLAPVVYIDLVGLDEASARARLREELAAMVRGERLLAADPVVPGQPPPAVTRRWGGRGSRPRFSGPEGAHSPSDDPGPGGAARAAGPSGRPRPAALAAPTSGRRAGERFL